VSVRGAADTLVARLGAGDSPTVARAPGRINLIGEHTDYNDGFVMPTPIDRFVEAAVRRRTGDHVRISVPADDPVVAFTLGDRPDPAWPSWSAYLYGMTETLRLRGLLSDGFDLAVSGNIPQGAGLSSSAALTVATFLALEGAFGLALDPLDSVRLCRDVEHRWANVQCGLMDPMVCRFGRRDHALLLDCRDLTFRQVPLRLGDHRLVIVDSGVRRRLEDSSYNLRRQECERGVELLRQIDPEIRTLRDVDPERLETANDLLPAPIAARCGHVVEENRRVLASDKLLSKGNLEGFGALMFASHESLRDRFEVSHPALDRLVEAARSVDGVLGSRLCGAGFGGCTLTLCSAASLDAVCARVDQTLNALATHGAILVLGPAVEAGVVSGAS